MVHCEPSVEHAMHAGIASEHGVQVWLPCAPSTKVPASHSTQPDAPFA